MDPRISPPEKGKGKADDNRGASVRTDSSSSLTTRVFQSAAGLARDFASSSNGELASTLASSSAVADKSQRANGSIAPTGWREGFTHHNDRALSGGSTPLQNPTQNDSFRSVQIKGPTELDFQSFITETGYQANLNVNQPESASTWTNPFAHNAHASHTNNLPTETYISEIRDGAEVIQLLSDPTFFAGPDPSDMTALQDLNEQQVRDLFPQEFTETEQRVVNHIKSKLPPLPTHKPMPADHPLNLHPNERMLKEIEDLTVSIENGLNNHFASVDLRERWLSEWNDVLNSYSDDVWGELLPDVQTAKTQLEEMRTGADNLDAKAIARLKMILRHVREQNIESIPQQPSYPPQGLSREGDGFKKPVFHCPWISCHEQFDNEWNLKLHSRLHRAFACPHTGCEISLTDQDDWAKHISSPHHGQLDTRPTQTE